MRSLILLFCATSLFARLNPFIPTMDIETITDNTPEGVEFFTEENIYLPTTSRILKQVKLVHQNIDGSVEVISKNIDKKVDWHNPVRIFQEFDATEARKYSYVFKKLDLKNIDFLNLNTAKNAVLIDTDDKIIRSFMLTKPYRIVIDFKRDQSFSGKSSDIKDSYFKRVVIGNHDGYYRTVLYLDSYYDYKLDHKEKGYLIELKQ